MLINDEENRILQRLALEGLERCLSRLSGASAAAWELDGSEVFRATLPEALARRALKEPAAAAVYFDVKGDFPFSSLMLFDHEDTGHFAKCFMGESFTWTACSAITGEVIFLELGNIVLNSLMNSLLNVLKRNTIPTLPRYAAGDGARIAAALGTVMDVEKDFRIFKATLTVKRGGCARSSQVLAMIPDGLAAELAKIVLAAERNGEREEPV